jgi:chromosome segregation ATPase
MEKSHKGEISQLRMRHDSRILQLNQEIATLRQQFSKAGRERDTFRDMLEGAQKTISDLRQEGKAAKEQLGQNFEHKARINSN